MSDAATETVICWVLSKPVLTKRLREIAIEEVVIQDGDQELICTVVDLLDPKRSALRQEFLSAVGICAADADAVWEKLGGDSGWMNIIHWQCVRRALLNQDGRDEGHGQAGLHLHSGPRVPRDHG